MPPLGSSHAAQRAGVSFECGGAEPGHLCGGKGCDRLAEELGGLTPAAAQGQGDVVPLHSGEACDVGGGSGGDLERIRVRIVERVGGEL